VLVVGIGGLVLLLVATAFTAARHLPNGQDRTYLSSVRWPLRGQAALVLGNGRAAASPHEQPVPIASLAKVMTAYLSEMNVQARTLGMDHTIYPDPSGFDPSTVSTAAEQLRVFERAMRFPVFHQIVSMASVTLPVAGTLTNYNPVIAKGYAGKTGSDSAAGACLAFLTHVTVGRRRLTAVGVVLGQGQSSETTVILAAGEAATRLVESVAPAIRLRTIAAPGAGGPGGDAGRHGPPLVLAPGRTSAQS
jgi:hypothetical protein